MIVDLTQDIFIHDLYTH